MKVLDYLKCEPEWRQAELAAFRKNAVENLLKSGFPTLKNEEWKFTNLNPLYSADFKTSSEKSVKNISDFIFVEHVLVFVNGKFDKKLSKISELPKAVIVCSLAEAILEETDLIIEHLGKYARSGNPFTDLNSIMDCDGAFVYIPRGVSVGPIQFLYISNGSVISHARNLVIMEENSETKILETYFSEGEEASFLNIVSEIKMKNCARLEYYKIQDENLNSFNIGSTEFNLEKNSHLRSFSITLGGKIVRNDLNINFVEEFAEANLDGLFISNKDQLVDNHTLVDHRVSHCTSNEYYKGVLKDKSTGVFNGKIHVEKDAQKTNSYQLNKSVLLSDDATMNSKPQLEIFADDVKCTHGATIGELDKEALFYLQARGIDRESAQAILIHAFVNDIMEKIKVEKLLEYLTRRVSEKL